MYLPFFLIVTEIVRNSSVYFGIRRESLDILRQIHYYGRSIN